MANRVPSFSNIATRLVNNAQTISDTKWSQKIIPLGVCPPTIDFFLSAPSADACVDNYDAGNQLVTSGKQFVINSLAVTVISSSIADIDNVINRGVLVLTCQNKEIGRFRVRELSSSGGTFVAGAQVAAANSVGVTNGSPAADPWNVIDLLIDTNQSFKASLWMPSGTPVTLIAATTVEVALNGYTVQPAA